jgi:hypothetical protein
MEPTIRELMYGLYAGDLEAILLTVLIAADEYRVPCGPEAEARILLFLQRLSHFDTVLPEG